jgi:threonine dehydrogenase-like Zn-dependent dehydrogenase
MTENTTTLPETQHAVQLIGKNELRLNTEKPVVEPTGRQILCRVEATGLCFSDLKLLKQFTDHPRKVPIVEGMAQEELEGIPSYVPGDRPTVPGHETVIRIVAIGDKVKNHQVGERCLVQSDYRHLVTKSPSGRSNGAFGYNIEGGLQEYVIIDERVSLDIETGERFLLPVGEEKSRSAIALVEPWACVEDSYLTEERQTLKAGGKLLVVADPGAAIEGLAESASPDGAPGQVTCLCADEGQCKVVQALGWPVECAGTVDILPEQAFDDVVYFGADKATLEALSPKLGERCIVNIVTSGKKIGSPANIGVGRIHYGLTRWIGTASANAADSYGVIPATGEVRENDKCIVVGAGGPMGQMHVLRIVCSGIQGLDVVATDFDAPRLDSLESVAAPLAAANGIQLRVINPQNTPLKGTYTYCAIMVPVPALVSQAIVDAEEGCLVNIFAGIPAPTVAEIDLDAVIEKRIFLFGTSGSVLRDMKIVLEKVAGDRLDTNFSVDAVSGMAGAIDGIAAVENRTLAGKIIVYPELHDLALTPLTSLGEKFPTVAEKLDGELWTKEAENELLRVAR